MPKELRVLMLEDSPADAELARIELKREGLDFTSRRVETREDFLKALDDYQPDIVLADYSLPSFDGLSALDIVTEKAPGLPFVFVSGTIGEETAVEALKNGATDYVIKDRLARLGPSVRRALREKEEEAKRRKTEEALRISEDKYRLLVENAGEAVFILQGIDLKYVNPKGLEIAGCSSEELISSTVIDMVHQEYRQLVQDSLSFVQSGNKLDHPIVCKITNLQGRVKWIEANLVRVEWGGNPAVLGMATDVSARMVAEEERNRSYRASEERYRDLVSRAGTAKEGVVLVQDSDSTAAGHVFANKEWCRITGYALQELYRRSFVDLFQAENRKSMAELVQRWLSGKDSPGFQQMAVVNKEGQKVPVEVAGSPTVYQGRSAAVCYVRDVTERVESDQLKDEFIGLVSHEMKTPLTVIVGGLATFLTDQDRLSDEEKRGLISDAAAEADELSRILENLLDLSRWQAKRLRLVPQLVSVKAVASKVTRILERQYSHCLALDIAEDFPLVLVDPLRLERILYNLVHNAIKYSPAGSRVDVFARVNGDNILIGVRDQGIGLSVADQAKLFSPFQRIEGGPDHPGGTGLGLLVCLRLVEAHGGRIWVESEPEKGSVFCFTLPLKAPST